MTKKRITITEAKRMSTLFKINHNVVPFDQFHYGLNVELEHGTMYPISNITDDDLILTTKIAIAHLLEYPNYYDELYKMENKLEREWKNKPFSIFLLN